jgi:ankyrin repeat protein
LEHGADVDAQDNDGDTPLIWAATEGYSGLVNMLLDAGANVNNSGSVHSSFETAPKSKDSNSSVRVLNRMATQLSLGR